CFFAKLKPLSNNSDGCGVALFLHAGSVINKKNMLKTAFFVVIFNIEFYQYTSNSSNREGE
ncbi:MAG: hypothetical protein ACI9CD_001227, partial [Candidatus Deianiraeaceae bacterium]